MPRRDAALALALLAVPFLASLPGSRGAALPLGPNAGAYLLGFEPLYELSGLEAARWAAKDATVALPLVARGPLAVSYRLRRVLPAAEVVVELEGLPLDRFAARGGVVVERSAKAFAASWTRLRLRFVTVSEHPSPRGLRFDWIRVEPLRGGRLRPSAPWLALGGVVLAAAFLSFRWVGLTPALAAALVSPLALLAAVGVAVDPLGFAHVVRGLAPVGLVLLALAGLALRAKPAGRWALVALALAFFGRGALLLHPRSDYPDFGNARRFILALADTEGPLAERALAAQRRTNVGYPRYVGGKPYAFPYSPLFFLPALWPDAADAIEAAYRLAGLVPATLEVIAVFLVARLCFPRSPAVPAVAPLLAALLPPLTMRLLQAMTITLVAHLFDVLLVAAAVAYLRCPGARRLGLLFGAALFSQLLYVSSLFTVGAFLLLLACLERRHALRLLGVLAVTGSVTVLWLYHPFLVAFWREILPALAAGAVPPAPAGSRGLSAALARIPIFYGWAFPLLALAGLVRARAVADRAAASALTAWTLGFALLVALRAFGGGLFRDLKEIEFAAPLVAIGTASSLEGLAAAGRRRAALLVGAGLALFSIGRVAGFARENLSPFTEVRSTAAPPAAVPRRVGQRAPAQRRGTRTRGAPRAACASAATSRAASWRPRPRSDGAAPERSSRSQSAARSSRTSRRASREAAGRHSSRCRASDSPASPVSRDARVAARRSHHWAAGQQ
jgi:hypothetical protein